jgi:high-affinity nickel permease
MELVRAVLKMIKVEAGISYTKSFSPAEKAENDFRYTITPKKKSGYQSKSYTRVFRTEEDQSWRLSIVDILFNMGPDTAGHLKSVNAETLKAAILRQPLQGS